MSTQFIGAKRKAIGAHYGLSDWLMQRISGALLAIFFITLSIYLVFSDQTFDIAWRALFAYSWVKNSALLAFFALFYHAWLGMRDILMDYIKPLSLRLFLYTFVIVWLLLCALYTVRILWP